MAIRSLKAESRKRTGSGVLKEMRREGYIPSVIYGTSSENKNVKVVSKTLNDLLKEAPSSNILVDLDVEGEVQQVFIQDLQFDNLKQEILHVDFLAVDEKTELRADLPVILKGEPKGVKLGGLLEQLLYTIPVKCFPQDLPETLTTSVAHLDVSEAMHIGEMEFPSGVSTLLNEKVVVALVAKTRVAQSATAAEEED